MKPTLNTMDVKPNSALELLEMAVLAAAIAGLLYFAYFQLAPWIWSQNLPVVPEEIVPWNRYWMEERDGIEVYALYVLMFADLFLAAVLIRRWDKLANRPARYFLVLPLAAVACLFIGSVGFHPPMNTVSGHPLTDILAWTFKVMAVILPIIVVLHYLLKRSAKWALIAAIFLLVPICFITTRPISSYDYAYVLAPALRLLQGAGISDIYFQYDLLLSLIALAWMKLQLDLNLFQVIPQFSYYLLFLGIFFFSRKWFFDKRLPVLLLVAIVLVRIYASSYDAVWVLQVTPLRLDLWLGLLMLVYFKGPHHWSAGLLCGLALLLHNNFGIIYSAAYIQLLLTLCVMDVAKIPGRPVEMALSVARNFLIKNYRNLAIMLAGAMTQYLLFRNAEMQGGYGMVNLKLGFIQIATSSFYWYVVVASGLAFALLIRLRARVDNRYLVTGLCLIYLAIGNSIYFFGRSHENNIINISTILLLLFFLLLDIVSRYLGNASGKTAWAFIQRNMAIIVSIAAIASISIWNGGNITNKAAIQWRNANKGHYIYLPEVPKQEALNVVAEVKSVVGDNPKVYFVGHFDFLLNYYGGYSLVGYYNPVSAWMSKSEFNRFLLGLADQGYFLVVDIPFLAEMPPPVRLFNFRAMEGRLVMWK